MGALRLPVCTGSVYDVAIAEVRMRHHQVFQKRWTGNYRNFGRTFAQRYPGATIEYMDTTWSKTRRHRPPQAHFRGDDRFIYLVRGHADSTHDDRIRLLPDGWQLSPEVLALMDSTPWPPWKSTKGNSENSRTGPKFWPIKAPWRFTSTPWGRLDRVVVGHGRDMGVRPTIETAYDPTSRSHLAAGTYPGEIEWQRNWTDWPKPFPRAEWTSCGQWMLRNWNRCSPGTSASSSKTSSSALA